jgi:hypothetical protein
VSVGSQPPVATRRDRGLWAPRPEVSTHNQNIWDALR